MGIKALIETDAASEFVCDVHLGEHFNQALLCDAVASRPRISGMNPSSPSIGPGNRIQLVCAPSDARLADAMVIEITEMKKPMLF